MNKIYQRLCLAAGCALIAAGARAQNIYLVSPGGGATATPHTSVTASDWVGASDLQTALAAANADSGSPEIWVKSGTYKPAVYARDSSFVITKDSLKLFGGFAGGETSASQRDPVANPVILSGNIGALGTNTDNSYHVMVMLPVSADITAGTVIDGLTVTGGYADNNTYSNAVPQLGGYSVFQGWGAGMLIMANNDGTFYYNSVFTYYSVSPTITRCAFTNCRSGANTGGAITVRGLEGRAAPSFYDCQFAGDTCAGPGGAISYYEASTNPQATAQINIINSSFTANRGSTGGAFYLNGSSLNPLILHVSGCTFISNFSTTNGGGAIKIDISYAKTLIDSCFFIADTGRLGGAVTVTATTDTNYRTTINRCYFYGNRGYISNSASAGTGGAIYTQSCNLSINNSVFASNAALGTSSTTTAGGGAIAVGSSANVTLNNSTLFNDFSFATGGRKGSHEVVLQSSNSIFTANNSILWNSFSDSTVMIGASGGTATYNYSDVRSNPAVTGTGTITSYPFFRDTAAIFGFDNILGTSDDGLTLNSTSPAINAGSNTYAPAGKDFAGNTRIRNTTVDMGAYEYFLQPGPFNGLAFDGTDDYVASTNNIGITGAHPRTLEYRAKLSDVYAHQIGWGSTGNTGEVFGTYTDGSGHFMFYGWGSADFATGFVPDGAMHHVAVSYDSTSVRVYVDGTLTSAGAVARTLNTGNGKLYLGVREDLSSSTFSNTVMDEVRVWNRALCPDELQNNMGGELPNPGGQNGLLLYYKFDQGTASGTNTGITSVTDAGSAGNNGTLNNFSLTGSTSNFVAGAAAIGGDVSPYAPATPSSATESGSQTVNGTTTINGCGAIATVAPSGASPVSGPVTGTVTEDTSVQSYGGHAYVQRHYDITPAVNASTSTGTITLYFTQADFTAYNAANGSDPDLPTSGSNSDPNIGNLRITQYHGTGTTPGTYTGSAVLITPSTVNYNTTAARWEVTFDVTGFSGFYVTGNLGAPLPLRLIAFNARPSGSAVQLAWTVAGGQDMLRYTVERSADGARYLPVASHAADGATRDYKATDAYPLKGRAYYRLSMAGRTGDISYSNTELVMMSGEGASFRLSPVPARERITLTTGDEALSGTLASLTDMQGRLLKQIHINLGSQEVPLDGLQAGTYMLRLANGKSYLVIKE